MATNLPAEYEEVVEQGEDNDLAMGRPAVRRQVTTEIDPNTGKPYVLCQDCGCPILPKGVKKRPNEYDHARGCPQAGKVGPQ